MISPLLTDLYQLTMAYGYWKLNLHEREAVFHQIFRKNPFGGNYAIACGLETVIDFLKNWRFEKEDLQYLSELKANDGSKLFPNAFLNYLKTLRFTCSIDAIPEGTVVFPNEPLIRITGPLLQAQLVESTILNIVNFQSLIATKASRVCRAAAGDPVLEFGMRRSQGPDGALSASRAAYIGGCDATSNVLAGKLFDIPVRGTHAHSWVTVFPSEKEAFKAYADVMPNNCVLLVDTFDTINGVKNAIEVGKELERNGGKFSGIRLDSGDMATLSIQARKLLDAAGFKESKIIASNSLDEYTITQMKKDGAKIDIWGVGTNLMTAYDHPALDGVYKLSALRDEKNQWQYKLKISEQPVKISNPGAHQVRRFFVDESAFIDVIYDLQLGIEDSPEVVLLTNDCEEKKLADYDAYVDLLIPIFKKGKCIYPKESIHEIRQRAIQETALFIKTHGDDVYPVALEKRLFDLKKELIER